MSLKRFYFLSENIDIGDTIYTEKKVKRGSRFVRVTDRRGNSVYVIDLATKFNPFLKKLNDAVLKFKQPRDPDRFLTLGK